MRPNHQALARLAVALAFAAPAGRAVEASSIPSYAVTDLGAGVARVSAPTGGDATLTAPDGRTVYAFPRTDNLAADSGSLFAQFPPFTDAPVHASGTYGDPRFAYSQFNGLAFLNANGVFAASKISGVSGHHGWDSSSALTAQRQADGSFGPLTTLWTTSAIPGSGDAAEILSLNARDQILGIKTPSASDSLGRTFVIDDLRTGELTRLDQLLPGVALEFNASEHDFYLDDQGRILVYGIPWETDRTPHAYLLTPAGLASDPIATPEPSSLATIALAAAGLAIRRRFGR